MVGLAGKPMLLRADGHYVLWESAATARAGAAAWHAADTGTTSLHAVEAAEMARLASLVGVPIAGALRFQGRGQITDLRSDERSVGKGCVITVKSRWSPYN